MCGGRAEEVMRAAASGAVFLDRVQRAPRLFFPNCDDCDQLRSWRARGSGSNGTPNKLSSWHVATQGWTVAGNETSTVSDTFSDIDACPIFAGRLDAAIRM